MFHINMAVITIIKLDRQYLHISQSNQISYTDKEILPLDKNMKYNNQNE